MEAAKRYIAAMMSFIFMQVVERDPGWPVAVRWLQKDSASFWLDDGVWPCVCKRV
jgi:hypothetical protein